MSNPVEPEEDKRVDDTVSSRSELLTPEEQGGARPSAVVVKVDGPGSAAPTEAGVWLKVGVALAIVVAALNALFPLATGWLFGVGVATTFGGEVLSRTNGLDPGPFEVGYWFSLWFNVAVIGWSVARLFTKAVHPWRPLFWAALLQAVVFGVWGTLDAQGVLEAPDGMTTAAGLGVVWLWIYVLPLVLLVLLVKLGLALWGLAAKSPANARRVIAGSTMTVLMTTFLIGIPSMPGVSLHHDEGRSFGLWRAPPGDSEGERAVYIKAAAALTSWEEDEKVAAKEDRQEFTKCMKALGTSDDFHRSVVERAVHDLATRTRLADAQDLVYGTLLNVCLRYAERRLDNLFDYFWKSLKNAHSTHCRRSARTVQMANEDLPVLEECRAFSSYETEASLLRAARRLPEKKQKVLHMQFYEGRSHREIGELVGTSEEGARQLSSRAIRDLREALQETP